MTMLIRHSGISETAAFNSAKQAFSKITKPFPEFLIYKECNNKHEVYAEFKCFNFKRIKYLDYNSRYRYKTVYSVKKIKYDNTYDISYTGIDEDEYLNKQSIWYSHYD